MTYVLNGVNYFEIEDETYVNQNCVAPYVFIGVNEQYRSYSFWLGAEE